MSATNKIDGAADKVKQRMDRIVDRYIGARERVTDEVKRVAGSVASKLERAGQSAARIGRNLQDKVSWALVHVRDSSRPGYADRV